jgi:hypothetical protein
MSVTCIEFRNTIGADPSRREPALLRHRLECRGCGEFARGVEQLDGALALALAVPVPEGLAHRVVLRATAASDRRPLRRALAAVAAVALLALGALLGRSGLAPADPLPAEVLAHAHHEPHSWDGAAVPVAATRLQAVLDAGEVRLLDAARLGPVTYANSCRFRGHAVPHLMVQGASGPVMVLLLPSEELAGEQRFAEDGLEGLLVPVDGGSIAIVAADPASLEGMRRRIVDAVQLGI